MATTHICPYFRRERGLKISCEWAVVTFPSAAARRGFVYIYCGSMGGWKNCCLAKALDRYYEEEQNGAGK